MSLGVVVGGGMLVVKIVGGNSSSKETGKESTQSYNIFTTPLPPPHLGFLLNASICIDVSGPKVFWIKYS